MSYLTLTALILIVATLIIGLVVSLLRREAIPLGDRIAEDPVKRKRPRASNVQRLAKALGGPVTALLEGSR